jgi:hypothetical protein
MHESPLRKPPRYAPRTTRVGRRLVECYVEDINVRDSYDWKYSIPIGCARGSDGKDKSKGKVQET